tara:strand:+ start:5375 stop:5584 length:210 start_codon:yes stop_codon:yes gene_type:complete
MNYFPVNIIKKMRGFDPYCVLYLFTTYCHNLRILREKRRKTVGRGNSANILQRGKFLCYSLFSKWAMFP